MDEELKQFLETFTNLEPRFEKNKADISVLRSIFAWIWKWDKDNILELDYSKGLFLYGSIGRGKTLTLYSMREYLVGLSSRQKEYCKNDYRLGTYWKSASQLATMFACKGIVAIDEYLEPECCLFIDELGWEPNPVYNFGTKLDVIGFLLQTRYENRRSSVTHITTNLSFEKITEIYGEYIADRFLEMFNFIEIKGESLRQS